MTPRDKLDTEFPTVELRNRLYEIRDEALNHLALYEPDQKITDLLKEAEKRISYWVNVNHKYLITDKEYYERMAHRILEPVYTTLNSRAGVYDDLEEEREKAVETRDRLAEQLETLRSNVNHYYGSFGGCYAWEGKP